MILVQSDLFTFHSVICFNVNIKNIDKCRFNSWSCAKRPTEVDRPQPFSQRQQHGENVMCSNLAVRAGQVTGRHSRWKTSKQTHAVVSVQRQLQSRYSTNRQPNINAELQKWWRGRLMRMPYDRWGNTRQQIGEQSVREKRENWHSFLRLWRRHNRLVDSRTEFWGSASGQSQDRNTTHHGQKSALPKDDSNPDFYPDLLIGSQKGK